MEMKNREKDDLASRIARAMEWRRFTQGQLAKYSGLDQSYVSMIVNRKRSPGFDKVVAIADTLDVSVDWLAGREQEDPETLDPEEQRIIEIYRHLADREKQIFLGMAESFGQEVD